MSRPRAACLFFYAKVLKYKPKRKMFAVPGWLQESYVRMCALQIKWEPLHLILDYVLATVRTFCKDLPFTKVILFPELCFFSRFWPLLPYLSLVMAGLKRCSMDHLASFNSLINLLVTNCKSITETFNFYCLGSSASLPCNYSTMCKWIVNLLISWIRDNPSKPLPK